MVARRLAVVFVLAIALPGLGNSPDAEADHRGEPIEILPLDGISRIGIELAGAGNFVVFSALRDHTGPWIGYFRSVSGGPFYELNPPGSELRTRPMPIYASNEVVFVTGESFRDEELWSMNLVTHERTKIAAGPRNEITIIDNWRSADGDQVAQVSVDVHPSTLTIYPVSGGQGVEVGPHGPELRVSTGGNPFTPDSRYVVYSKNGPDGTRTFSHRLVDGVRTPLGPWREGGATHAVSMDSSTVAFSAGRALRSASIDGEHKTILGRFGADEFVVAVDIAASGTHAAFAVSDRDTIDLWVAEIGVAQSAHVVARGIPATRPFDVSISPEGTWLTYEHDGYYAVSTSGGTAVLLDGRPFVTRESPRFLPGDRGILVTADIGGNSVPAIASPIDGTVSPLVTDWPDGWDSSSHALLYPLGGDLVFSARGANERALYRVSIAGGRVERLDDPSIDGGYEGPYFTLSPDGKYLIYDASGNLGEASRFIVDIGYRCGGRLATLVGTTRADSLEGTSGDDVIVARRGSDTINGRGGADVICGGIGDDHIRAGAGPDTVFGQRGNDVVGGGVGSDRIMGGTGRDRLRGRAGADVLNGGAGESDVCRGGKGVDRGINCETVLGIP